MERTCLGCGIALGLLETLRFRFSNRMLFTRRTQTWGDVSSTASIALAKYRMRCERRNLCTFARTIKALLGALI
jgi:hypothetical protein